MRVLHGKMGDGDGTIDGCHIYNGFIIESCGDYVKISIPQKPSPLGKVAREA